MVEVEQTIIDTFRNSNFQTKEIVFDPARWQRTFMVLDEQGMPVVSYPNSAERMVPATQKFYEAVVNQSFTHDGDERMARHITNCVTKQSSRGVMVAKARLEAESRCGSSSNLRIRQSNATTRTKATSGKVLLGSTLGAQ